MYNNEICTDSKMTIVATNLTYFTSEILHIGLKIKILHAKHFITKHIHNTSLLVKYCLHEIWK